MATIIRSEERDFQPNPNKIDGFRLFTDATRAQKGVNPQWLNFDVRRLNPHECNQLGYVYYRENLGGFDGRKFIEV